MKSEVTFAVLADAHKVGSRGKVDCYGIFTSLGIWATPANRECSIVVGLADIRKGTHNKAIWLRHVNQRAKKIGKIQVNATEPVLSAVISHRLPFQITKLGKHEIGVSDDLHKSPTNAFWIPFVVEQMPWPEPLSGDMLKAALEDPHTIKRVGAILKCTRCQKTHKFEILLDPRAKRSKGTRAFPADGRFYCAKCRKVHFLKDIEGQVRNQLGRSTAGENK